MAASSPYSGTLHKKVFFAAYGLEGPWACVYCGELITERGRHTRSLNIHHIDEDTTNNTLSNLAAMHRRCHVRHHQVGSTITDQHKERIAAANRTRPQSYRDATAARMRGRVVSDVTRARLSQAHTGKKVSEDQKLRTSRTLKVRTECDDCGGWFTPVWMTRHKTEGKCR